MFESFGGVFDYFSLWNESNDSFLGKDKPNEMKHIVKGWNKGLAEQLLFSEKNIKKKLNEHGVKHIAEYISKDMYIDIDFYNFRTALCAMTGHFTYGQDCLYFSEDYGWCTYLPKEVEKML